MTKFIITIILTSYTLANPSGNMSKVTQEAIKSLLQSNPGCPENASCTKEQGILYQTFINSLSQGKKSILKFSNDQGFPIRLWSKAKSSNEEITYDSKCFHHRKKDKTFEVIKFIFNENEVSNKSKFLVHKYIGKKHSFVSSLNAIASYTTNNSLVSFVEYNGNIYSLKSTKKGSLNFSFKDVDAPSPRTVKCTPDLTQRFDKHLATYPMFKDHYKGTFCKEIYNIETKKFEPYIIGWSCHN